MEYYPITIVDNFLENPDALRNFALELSYTKSEEGIWPGVRSEPLHIINPELFANINKKVLSLYHSPEEMKGLHVSNRACFQIIDGSYDSGWIHTDFNQFSAILYLTPNADPQTGTSFYKRDKLYDANKLYQEKNKHYIGATQNSDEHKSVKDQQNSMFTKTATVNNIYNRLVLFDAHLYHGADKFVETVENEQRLTLVMFFEQGLGFDFPLQRKNRNPL